MTSILKQLLLSIALLQMVGLTSVRARAAGEAFELSSSEPSIFSVTPKAHPELGATWNKLKRAQLEAIAMWLEMYPEHEIYFLARDMNRTKQAADLAEALELEAVAKLAGKSSKKQASRIHVLSISRSNMNNPNMKFLLQQEGISAEAVRNGKKILFVDTGYSGTISKVVAEHLPPEFRSHLDTHFLTSGNPEHPSTRVFLTTVNPAAPGIHPSDLRPLTVDFEYLPKYTARSDNVILHEGKWESTSPLASAEDGEISKAKAQGYMEDIAASMREDETIQFLKQRRALWRRIYQAFQTEDPEQVRTVLSKILRDHPHDPFSEAVVRDSLDYARTNARSRAMQGLTDKDFGLKAINLGMTSNNKNELIEKFPKWKTVLENPEPEIKKMIEASDWQSLAKIADALRDDEFAKILALGLNKVPPSEGSKNLVKLLAGKQGSAYQNYLNEPGTWTQSFLEIPICDHASEIGRVIP